MALNIRVEGVQKTRDFFRRLGSKLRNIDNREFGERMKTFAKEQLAFTNKGWPNPESSPIRFIIRRRKLAKGTSLIMSATARGKDGFNYAAVQENGLPVARSSSTGKMMKFRTPSGGWVSKDTVGPIPAKHYMLNTALWAVENYPIFIEKKVRERIKSSR